MALLTNNLPVKKHDLQMALVVARREIVDSFRDWRIIIPIILLTLFFPALMNFTAGRVVQFAEDYGATLIGSQLIPFLLLVVGFFPMSFSLIIALETFVGEKERKSLEPLLATPLSNTQLYIGKMVAALVPPLTASYMGIVVYLVALRFTIGWSPTPQLLIQTIFLTTIQGIVMVAGAVVVSSQTTSVRAANLLASFIIIPVALLVQAEAVALFWGNHDGLWWLILGLAITAVVLMRMGIHLFNREELMGRDIDQLRLGWIWSEFWGRYSGRLENGRYPSPLTWYKQTFAILPQLKMPMGVMIIAALAAAIFGASLANTYPFSPETQAQLTEENVLVNLSGLESFAGLLPGFIFIQNVRVLLLLMLLGVFTFGVLGIIIFALPWGVIGFLVAQFQLAGQDPLSFFVATILPHAVVEFPALLIAAAAALRWHIVAIAPPPGRTLSEIFLAMAADFFRLLIGVAIPLLFLAACLEAFLTPQVVMWLYG